MLATLLAASSAYHVVQPPLPRSFKLVKEPDTPFMLACERGHVQIVQELLEKGCNTGLQNGEGRTGWEVARSEGRKEVDDLLRKYSESGAMEDVRAALAEELRLHSHLPEGSAVRTRAGRIPCRDFLKALEGPAGQ